MVFTVAEPFLGSLVAVALAAGIPTFVIIQWLAPIISEFPEFLSTFYFARQEVKAPVALMNIASSNINQWTLLVAMLPVVLSLSRGGPTPLVFDDQQRAELLLTIAQSFVSLIFLINMQFSWWEAVFMFALFSAQLVLPRIVGPEASIWLSFAFLIWGALALAAILLRRRMPEALTDFARVWKAHVRGNP